MAGCRSGAAGGFARADDAFDIHTIDFKCNSPCSESLSEPQASACTGGGRCRFLRILDQAFKFLQVHEMPPHCCKACMEAAELAKCRWRLTSLGAPLCHAFSQPAAPLQFSYSHSSAADRLQTPVSGRSQDVPQIALHHRDRRAVEVRQHVAALIARYSTLQSAAVGAAAAARAAQLLAAGQLPATPVRQPCCLPPPSCLQLHAQPRHQVRMRAVSGCITATPGSPRPIWRHLDQSSAVAALACPAALNSTSRACLTAHHYVSFGQQ